MSRKSVVKLHEIYEFFEGEVKLIKRGENAYESNHVERYYFNGDSHIDGQVHASMKDRIYNVEASIVYSYSNKSLGYLCFMPFLYFLY